MAHRLHRPFARPAADPPLPINVRHGLQELKPALDLRKLIDHQFDGERIGSEISASAQDLNDVPFIAQQNVLLAVGRLEYGAPTMKIAKRDDAAETGIAARPNIGSQNARESLGSPKQLRVEARLLRIGERYTCPRPRRA